MNYYNAGLFSYFYKKYIKQYTSFKEEWRSIYICNNKSP